MKRILFIILFTFIFFVFGIQTAWSHAYVVEQTPLPNSQHEISPTQIKITFNSEIENNFSLQVIDEENQVVESESPSISDDRKEISIQLPTLLDGIYKIEYYIISSNDGHTIQGDYNILVGKNNEPLMNQGSRNSLTNDAWGSSNVLEIIIYVLKALYYIGLVLVIGWVFWWQTIQNYSIDIRRKYLLWGIVLQMVHLVGLISIILIQVDIFTSKGLFFTPSFPFDTGFGLFWLISLVLSLIGFLCLFKNRWIDLIWISILLVCKSINGHASAFSFTELSIILNSIHLIAAAIWAAGLSFIVIFWRKHTLYVKEFLPSFSSNALISFILLVISGSILTIIYSPRFPFILGSWGIILIAKICLVAIVVLIANAIRTRIKGSHLTIGTWIRIDFLFMIVILVIVSVLTYLSPTQ